LPVFALWNVGPYSHHAGELGCARLVEGLAVGGQQDPAEGAVLPLQPLDGVDDRLGAQHHPRPAPERSIVDGPVPVSGEVPEVDEPHSDETLLLGDPEDARAEVRLEGVGEQGEDDEEHGAATPG